MNTFSNCGDNEKIIADADTDNKEIEMEMVEMAVELPVEILARPNACIWKKMSRNLHNLRFVYNAQRG